MLRRLLYMEGRAVPGMKPRIRGRAVVPSRYEPELGPASLAMESPWTQGCIETMETLTKTMEQMPAVATILSRYQRRRNCQVPITATDVYADTTARVWGNDVDLAPDERGLIHLKCQKVISGRRLVALLGRHQGEIRPE